MNTTTSTSTVCTLKAIFSRHGIPWDFPLDNSQYTSEEMATFAREYNFTHIINSPHSLQDNRFAEWMDQMSKNLIWKLSDPYTALLAYCNTLLPWCGLSPSQVLIGRQLRITVPRVESPFVPEWLYIATFRDLSPLAPDKTVWVHTQQWHI